MSRALSVIEDLPNLSGFDREAALMDESRLAFDLPPDDGGGEGDRIFHNQILRHWETGEHYVVIRGYLPGRGAGYHLLPVRDGKAVLSEATSPRGTWVTELGKAITVGGDGQVTGTRSLPQDWWLGEAGGGGGGYAPPAYMSTQPAQEAQFAHDQNMANLNAQLAEAKAQNDWTRQRDLELLILKEQQDFADAQRVAGEKFQADQQALAEEAMLKRERLGVLQNLVEGFLQSQQRATEFLHSLQPDAFRFAAAAQGMPVMGTTPQEGYAGVLEEYIQRPAPSMDPNAPLSAIESGIESIMGQQFPLQPDIFGRGMAAGGTVPMGASGTFLVGEKGPEVMDVTPLGVTVRPLSGGFQYGGGVDFDISSIMAGLAPLYASLGFSNIPTVTRRGPRGSLYFNPPGESGFASGRDYLEALGIRPNLVRLPPAPGVRGRHHTYYVEDGTLRHIQNAEDFERMGFNWGGIINLSNRAMEDYGWTIGDPLTEAPEFAPRPVGPMSTMPFATIEPTSSAPLPTPFKTAYEMRRLAATNPDLANLALGAYDFRRGIPRGAFQTAMETYTPRGVQRPLIGLR